MATPKGSGEQGQRRLPILLRPEELEVRTWIQFVRTFTRMERQLEEVLERHGLSIPQFDILATLGFEQGITQQELAERLLVTKGNICGMIDRMEASGWVKRKPDPDDRRVNRLFLTRQGKAQLDQAKPDEQAFVKEIMGTLKAVELQVLYQLLDRLNAAAGD
jgi:MarR family transcriptional regulator, organic hydroperoxide resistance regulator